MSINLVEKNIEINKIKTTKRDIHLSYDVFPTLTDMILEIKANNLTPPKQIWKDTLDEWPDYILPLETSH